MNHLVQFYRSEKYLCEAVGRFLETGFLNGHGVIMIARADRHPSFVQQLRRQGCNVDAALESGQLTQLDAYQTLETFMKGGVPDRDRFFETICQVMQKSRHGREQLEVFAYGEMVDILCHAGNHPAAIRLEELWNDLATTHSFKLLCAFPLDSFCKEEHYPQFESICDLHGHVTPTEDHMALDENKRMRQVSLLQQRSLALETEMARAKDLQRMQSFFRAIIDSAEDAIISKTLDGIITTWNPGAERIFGYTASEAIGKPITILIPPDHPDEEPRILERLRRGERIEHYETKRVHKNGTILDISLTVSPIIDDDGHIIGASKIARDITSRKQIENERNELLMREHAAREEAESANRIKDEFLAILSHELRTPLNVIVGWTGILASQKSPESVERAAEVIQRNASLQKRLIEDLLDLAGILTGKVTVRTDPVDLRGLAKAAVDSLRPAAAGKGIDLEFETLCSAHVIIGDADRLQQVIWNLLSNSIKFTPEGGKVRLQLRPAGSHVEIVVSDNGQGISADFLPFVFDRFRQAEQTTTRKHSGLGLGLALVRHLVELHGGTVVAVSPGKGCGATFTVSLPAITAKY